MTSRWAIPGVQFNSPFPWGAILPFFLGALFMLGDGGKPAPLLAIASAVGAAGTGLVSRHLFPRADRVPWFLLGGGLFMLWALLTALGSPSPLGAWRSLAGVSVYFGTAVLAGVCWSDTHRQVWRMFVLTGTLLQSLVWVGSGKLLLPGNPQYASFWAAVSLFLSLPLCVERQKNRWVSRAGVVGVLTSIHLLWVLPVRSGWVASAAGLLIYGAHRFGRRGVLSALLLISALSAMAPARLLKAEDSAAFKRVDIWRAAIRGGWQKPLTGWGLGQFESLYDRHALPQETEPVRYDRSTAFAHNDPLQVLAGVGLPGLLFAGMTLVGLWPRRRPGAFAGEKAALASALVFSLFNFPLAVPANAWLAGGLAGCLWPAAREIALPRPARWLRGARRMVFVGGIFWAVFNILLAADSLRGEKRNPTLGATDFLWLDARVSVADRLLHGGAPGGVDAAESILRGLLRGAPHRADLWRDLGHLEFDHRPRRWEAAEAAYAAALDRKPHHAPWWVERAVIAARRGEGGEAEKFLARALAAEPRYFEAALVWGQLKRLRGDPAGAARWLIGLRSRADRWPLPAPGASGYQRAILSRNDGGLALALALCYMDLGRAQEVLQELNGADPDHPDTWTLRGLALAKTGRAGEAAALFRRGRSRWPNDPRWGPLMKGLKETLRP